MPRASALSLVLVLGSTQAGCRARTRELAVVVGIPSGPTTLNPLLAREEVSYTVLGNIYDSLVKVDQELGLRGSMAESWENPDERTLVFRLRPGLRAQDGRKIAAAEVKESLDELNGLGLILGGEAIQRIDTQGEGTVVIHVRYPLRQLVYSVGLSALSWRGRDPAQRVGSGPYRVASFNPEGDTVLEAAFMDKPPAVRRVTFRVVRSAHERVQRLLRGELQVSIDIPAEDMGWLASHREVRASARAGLRVLLLGMDCRPQKKSGTLGTPNPFADVRVRRAISMAVDRGALVSGPLGGFADPVEQIVAPEVVGYVHGLPRSQPRLEQARALLRAAGLGSGFAVTLDYTPEKYRAMQGVAEALQGQLARIGVVVTLRPSPVAEFLGRLDGHGSRLFLEGWLTFRDASLSYAQLLHTPSDVVGKYNSSGYSDPDLDGWIDQAESEAAGDARDVHLKAIAEKVLGDWPMIPLYRQRDLCAWSAEIAFTPHPDRSLPVAEFEWAR